MKYREHTLASESGSTLLAVLIVTVSVCLLSMASLSTISQSFNAIDKRGSEVSAFNIAEAGKENAVALLKSGAYTLSSNTTVCLFNAVAFNGGTYTVYCSTTVAKDTVIIRSIGTKNQESITLLIRYSCKQLKETVGASINAAIRARSSVKVTGSIKIDGRNYDSLGIGVVTTADSAGVTGISSCGVVDQHSGASLIGGNGRVPVNPASSPIIEENVDPASYPKTPEAVLGIKEGALDRYKTTTMPSMPINGIVYYERDTLRNEFNCPNFNGGHGILIVHNSKYNATVRDLNGTFYGLLIVDKVELLNANAKVVGGIVTLSPDMDANSFGNGNALVLYSSQIIEKINSMAVIGKGYVLTQVSWEQVASVTDAGRETTLNKYHQ